MKAVVFGTFDGLHEGHRSLFSQARELADELVAIVARDATAERLKGRAPSRSEGERRAAVEEEPLVDRAVLGDTELSSYETLLSEDPDLICLGYDQDALAEDLERWMKGEGKPIKTVRLKPHNPRTQHSSLLNKGLQHPPEDV